MSKNPNCDNDKCAVADGEVRLLPTSTSSNLILCRTCFESEISWRKSRNKELGTAFQFTLPSWNELVVYKDKYGYPPNWPKCPGCGLPALDGHITCGQSACDEAGRR